MIGRAYRRDVLRLGSVAAAAAGDPKDIVEKLSYMMVEAGKTERIQKNLETFGIDRAEEDFMAEQGLSGSAW